MFCLPKFSYLFKGFGPLAKVKYFCGQKSRSYVIENTNLNIVFERPPTTTKKLFIICLLLLNEMWAGTNLCLNRFVKSIEFVEAINYNSNKFYRYMKILEYFQKIYVYHKRKLF